MDIKDMRSFVCLYEEGNLRRAANRLFITPQGLSRTLKAMENELSTQHFQRFLKFQDSHPDLEILWLPETVLLKKILLQKN